MPSLPVWTEAAASRCTATMTSNASAFRRSQEIIAEPHVCAFSSLCHHSGKTVSSFCQPLVVHYSLLSQQSRSGAGKTTTHSWRHSSVADVISSRILTRFATRATVCVRHKFCVLHKMFLKIFRNISCVRATSASGSETSSLTGGDWDEGAKHSSKLNRGSSQSVQASLFLNMRRTRYQNAFVNCTVENQTNGRSSSLKLVQFAGSEIETKNRLTNPGLGWSGLRNRTQNVTK